jgi:hypothetical protein
MERVIKMAHNGLSQFFVHVYCADGSFCEYGPFATGEEAAAQIYAIEHPMFRTDENEDTK